jgi:hypothetical protein
MATDRRAWSKVGLPRGSAVDIDALSTRAAYYGPDVRNVVITTAAGQTATAVFTQNATVKHNLGPVGFAGTLAKAFVSCTQLPAGGTLAVHLVAYDASGNAEIVLTETLNPEALTIREAGEFTLATTNVELAAEDTLELHCVASDDAVGTAAQGVRVTCLWSPTEATVPQR